MKIGIINNELGNIASVYSALKFYNFDISLINQPSAISKVDIIVLAGVGNFNRAVKTLKKLRFWDALNHAVQIQKKPIIGLCLGMQLFADVSFEDGENKGFGWIKGKVIRLNPTQGRVPHTGWDSILPYDSNIFQNTRYNSFYFMHSYHFIPDDPAVIIASCEFGKIKMVAGVREKNIVGVQFHPEKSQGDGLRLLRNLVETIQ
jgi:glutamine amidotransferase